MLMFKDDKHTYANGCRAQLGAIVVDWEKRDVQVRGAAGFSDGNLTLKELKELDATERAAGRAVYPYLFYPENEQLAVWDDVADVEDELDGEDDLDLPDDEVAA